MKIDILMATYNGEKYLREQLNSILNQSFTDFRLLISDDGSTDSTREILNEYVQKDNRIVVFLQEKNLGVQQNFAYLMQKVESEYFMFSDQDDIWQEDKIKKSIQKITETDCDLVYSDLEVVNQNLEIIEPSYWKLKGFEKKIKNDHNFESLYLNNYITGSTILAKSKWLEKILPLPVQSKYILHDYWTALIISQFGKITYIEEPLVQYRQHVQNQVGSKKRSDEIQDFDEMRDLFLDVKIDHFQTFVENENAFEKETVKELSKKSLAYFKRLKQIKMCNFRNMGLFWKLYQYENFSYAFQNYLILNLPGIAKILFKLKKGIKKK